MLRILKITFITFLLLHNLKMASRTLISGQQEALMSAVIMADVIFQSEVAVLSKKPNFGFG